MFGEFLLRFLSLDPGWQVVIYIVTAALLTTIFILAMAHLNPVTKRSGEIARSRLQNDPSLRRNARTNN
ncbi:MAG: hypothetical protein ACD_58C00269G0005 [uncultured bacterium]|nr:MAG: hypothetical protein ACD_58C00269G0005 [uncultured bacterium]